MAITKYEKDGKTYWQVYVNVRSKNEPGIRKQKRVSDLVSERQAIAEEKKILVELTQDLTKAEGAGLTWLEIIERWEIAMLENKGSYAYMPTTIIDYIARLKTYTEGWLNKQASELGKADGREVLRQIQQKGKTRKFQKMVKDTVNTVYTWAIEERLIRGVQESPMRGLELTASKEEKVPEILTLEQIKILLCKAKKMEHDWYPIWAMALLTGMRNGELFALEWTDVDFENRRIRVSKSYHTRMKVIKCTKSGAWRTVPISDELMALLGELKRTSGDRKSVLPRIGKWQAGFQAEVLRAFCAGIGIPSVRFHALRACFATQLLAANVPPAQIMKICGWTQLDTMQHYVRMAGIDERGVTESLKFMPSNDDVMNQASDIFGFKRNKVA